MQKLKQEINFKLSQYGLNIYEIVEIVTNEEAYQIVSHIQDGQQFFQFFKNNFNDQTNHNIINTITLFMQLHIRATIHLIKINDPKASDLIGQVLNVQDFCEKKFFKKIIKISSQQDLNERIKSNLELYMVKFLIQIEDLLSNMPYQQNFEQIILDIYQFLEIQKLTQKQRCTIQMIIKFEHEWLNFLNASFKNRYQDCQQHLLNYVYDIKSFDDEYLIKYLQIIDNQFRKKTYIQSMGYFKKYTFFQRFFCCVDFGDYKDYQRNYICCLYYKIFQKIAYLYQQNRIPLGDLILFFKFTQKQSQQIIDYNIKYYKYYILYEIDARQKIYKDALQYDTQQFLIDDFVKDNTKNYNLYQIFQDFLIDKFQYIINLNYFYSYNIIKYIYNHCMDDDQLYPQMFQFVSFFKTLTLRCDAKDEGILQVLIRNKIFYIINKINKYYCSIGEPDFYKSQQFSCSDQDIQKWSVDYFLDNAKKQFYPLMFCAHVMDENNKVWAAKDFEQLINLLDIEDFIPSLKQEKKFVAKKFYEALNEITLIANLEDLKRIQILIGCFRIDQSATLIYIMKQMLVKMDVSIYKQAFVHINSVLKSNETLEAQGMANAVNQAIKELENSNDNHKYENGKLKLYQYLEIEVFLDIKSCMVVDKVSFEYLYKLEEPKDKHKIAIINIFDRFIPEFKHVDKNIIYQNCNIQNVTKGRSFLKNLNDNCQTNLLSKDILMSVEYKFEYIKNQDKYEFLDVNGKFLECIFALLVSGKQNHYTRIYEYDYITKVMNKLIREYTEVRQIQIQNDNEDKQFYFKTMLEISKTFNLINDFKHDKIEKNFQQFIQKYGICPKIAINLEQKLLILIHLFKEEAFKEQVVYDCLKILYKEKKRDFIKWLWQKYRFETGCQIFYFKTIDDGIQIIQLTESKFLKYQHNFVHAKILFRILLFKKAVSITGQKDLEIMDLIINVRQKIQKYCQKLPNSKKQSQFQAKNNFLFKVCKILLKRQNLGQQSSEQYFDLLIDMLQDQDTIIKQQSFQNEQSSENQKEIVCMFLQVLDKYGNYLSNSLLVKFFSLNTKTLFKQYMGFLQSYLLHENQRIREVVYRLMSSIIRSDYVQYAWQFVQLYNIEVNGTKVYQKFLEYYQQAIKDDKKQQQYMYGVVVKFADMLRSLKIEQNVKRKQEREERISQFLQYQYNKGYKILLPTNEQLNLNNIEQKNQKVIEKYILQVTSGKIAKSLTQPLFLTMYDQYKTPTKFLLKHEQHSDVRKEQRVISLVNYVNKLLKRDKIMRQLDIQFDSYQIIPIGISMNLIEILQDTQEVKQCQPQESQQSKYSDQANKKMIKEFILKNELDNKISIFNRFITFTKSYAAWSAFSAMIGLGDRHLANIMIHKKTKKIAFIDFDLLFLKGCMLKVPEIVSYRMTSSIIKALDPHGPYSLFFLYMKLFYQFFNKNIDSIESFLTIFKNDILFGNDKQLCNLYAEYDLRKAIQTKQTDQQIIDEIKHNTSQIVLKQMFGGWLRGDENNLIQKQFIQLIPLICFVFYNQ